MLGVICRDATRSTGHRTAEMTGRVETLVLRASPEEVREIVEDEPDRDESGLYASVALAIPSKTTRRLANDLCRGTRPNEDLKLSWVSPHLMDKKNCIIGFASSRFLLPTWSSGGGASPRARRSGGRVLRRGGEGLVKYHHQVVAVDQCNVSML